MSRKVRVLLATEGTYPYHLGGVSTWCDMLVHRVPDVEFVVFAVAMNPFVTSHFAFPESVRQVVTVPLWGTQDPSEHKEQVPFSEIFLQKQRTTTEEVERSFVPVFSVLLDQIARDGSDPEAVGSALAAMHRHFQYYDYRETFKSPSVFRTFRDFVQAAAADGRWPVPSVFEAVQGLGWLYHFFTVLNTTLPEVDLVHSSAAAFCGMAGIVAKIEYGTPYLLTEHGVYLREQYLSIGRSNMSRFSKRFLLAVVRTIVRANLHFADRVAPVCAFNARWERLLGAPRERIEVVYNGVSAQSFAPAEASGQVRAQDAILLSIARSDPNKDLETLLRAMAIVHRHFPRVKLDIRGAVSVPEYHERMLALRKELGLEEAVNFGGHAENVAQIYRGADILVQSSVSEAFPYAVIEGMMSSLPVVATDVGGTAEAIGDTGLLVPSRDPARLAVALMVLIQDVKLRERLGIAARERALTYFTTERAAQNYLSLYQGMAEGPLPVYAPQPVAASAGGRRLAALGVRALQKMHLDRAYALLRIGQRVAALDQFVRALEADPNGRAAAPILAEISGIEAELGQRGRALQHLLGAWVLAQIRSA